jgi:osmotically-inducible protein OsmY
MFARSTDLIPSAANVEAITSGNEVTLRGTVASAEEARLIEGMTRLTPGVRSVNNELTFPVEKR